MRPTHALYVYIIEIPYGFPEVCQAQACVHARDVCDMYILKVHITAYMYFYFISSRKFTSLISYTAQLHYNNCQYIHILTE